MVLNDTRNKTTGQFGFTPNRAIGKRHGRTPGEAAIAWTLHNPAVTAAIVGLRTAAQVDGVAGALELA